MGKCYEALQAKYPLLYRIPIYFECGPGWYDIINDLSASLEKEIQESGDLYIAEDWYACMYCTQVKEKYGTLRFYMSCETDNVSKLIREAEMLSRTTCEVCGDPGEIIKAAWVKVKCKKCN
jgi:DnaJ-class molecular chaperone